MIHEKIAEVLREKGESNGSCAKACGVQRTNLGSYLRTGTDMSISKVEVIMKYLGLEIVEKNNK